MNMIKGILTTKRLAVPVLVALAAAAVGFVWHCCQEHNGLSNKQKLALVVVVIVALAFALWLTVQRIHHVTSRCKGELRLLRLTVDN